MQKMVRLSVVLPEDMVKEIDEKVKKYQYASRSAFIRKAVYELLSKERKVIYA